MTFFICLMSTPRTLTISIPYAQENVCAEGVCAVCECSVMGVCVCLGFRV